MIHIVKATGLVGTPSSVVIDVYDDEDPGTLMTTIPNSEISRIGLTDTYNCNLGEISADIGMPADGSLEERHYTLIWRDDTGLRVTGDYFAVGFLPGPDASGRETRETMIYPSTTVPSRGIDQNVIDSKKPSYIKREVAPDLNFAAPAVTDYLILEYDSEGRVFRRTPSPTPPSP